MNYPRKLKNIKVCPDCGTNLIITAKHCAVCDYSFTDADRSLEQEAVELYERRRLNDGSSLYDRRRLRPFTLKQRVLRVYGPVTAGLILVLLAANSLIVFGLQRRQQADNLVAAQRATATYIATTYVSPTPVPTMTNTPGLPTETPVVPIEYEVLPGESCLSIADKFDIYLDALLLKNEIDCAALQVGTVLIIPPPAPTPETTSTPTP
jgi:hypothetical protein